MTSDIRSQLQEALGAGYVVGAEMPPGGMSRLFLATETALERTVVVKVLPPELTSEVSAERFRREMLLTARLRHPHILTVLNAGFDNGLLYFISPYIEGESLRARLVREPRLPASDVVHLVRELADALSCAHNAGVIHRDVKPENVLLEHGHAVLADFGVARALEQATGGVSLTGTGLGIGTPGYMAPEQLTGDVSLDGRADLYALGAMAYEMLAGTPLFDAKSTHQLVAAHLSATPIPLLTRRPDLQLVLAALVMRLVAKEPSERPGTAAEVSAALDLLSNNQPVPTRTRSRITRGGAIAAAGAILLVGYVGYYAARSRSQSPRVPPVAQASTSATQTPIVSLGAAQSKSIAVLPFVNMSDHRGNEY
ncbi:MAG: serine/threonine protein kinase, partial [Gemmatimonadota bacterium]|nr:serine/threonine protein kinase [Gemmatimonadota bacterium]